MSKLKLNVRKRQPGAKNRNNGNAIFHGCYCNFASQSLDGRSRLAKMYKSVVGNLTSELGGEPTAHGQLLIQAAAFKSIKCRLAEIEMLRSDNQTLSVHYLAWANSLRLDLQALGLQRRQRKVMELTDYLRLKSEEKVEA
jgi:hypothetical protein